MDIKKAESGGLLKWFCVGVIVIAFIIIEFQHYGKGSDLRIMLLGNTGTGKSSTGNTILGRDAFRVDFSLEPVTSECEVQKSRASSDYITVIDTPGLLMTTRTQEKIPLNEKNEAMKRCILLSSPGPHVFLLVVRLGRFTEEERNAADWIQENVGEEALKFTMILFTGGDLLEGKPIENILSHSSELQSFMSSFEGRYHVFNNKDRQDSSQVTELMEKIEALVDRNEGQCYNTDRQEKSRGSTAVVTVIILVAVSALFSLIVEDIGKIVRMKRAK
ncbi:GTPase IMAP family member 4-like [Colossoma macropomum]|uniref:GTPase IMAP family member 4-like n=1 Tax=Colossoma macropomum TaxID=42526 RepID=UPI0018641F72|nr:GTPase IMAP family member 4-like [Colossoma macropomum]